MTERHDWITQNISDDIGDVIVRLRIVLPNRSVVERDFRPDLEINYETLIDQLAETPSMYAFWSSVLAEQKTQVAKIERQMKRRRGAITDDILRKAKEDGLNIRSAELKDIIETDDKLLEIDTELMIASRALSKLYGIVRAIEMKSEHLRSLAGFKRQEYRDSV